MTFETLNEQTYITPANLEYKWKAIILKIYIVVGGLLNMSTYGV